MNVTRIHKSKIVIIGKYKISFAQLYFCIYARLNENMLLVLFSLSFWRVFVKRLNGAFLLEVCCLLLRSTLYEGYIYHSHIKLYHP